MADEDNETEAPEAEEAEDDDEEYEMDNYAKALAQKLEKQGEHIGQLVQIVKNQNDRIEALAKESPPEDDAEQAGEAATGGSDIGQKEEDETIDEPDEDAATEGGEDHNTDTGDGMTKGRTPKPVAKRVGNDADPFATEPFLQKGDPDRINKAVNDGEFLRKSWRDGDIATVANAAATAHRKAAGRGNNGMIRKAYDNDRIKRTFAKWAHKNIQGRDL